MPNYLELFAREMRTRRKEAGLSQEALAEKTDVSMALISEIERGIANPTIQTLGKIARYFDVTLTDMLTNEEYSDSIAQTKLKLISKILMMNREELEIISKYFSKF